MDLNIDVKLSILEVLDLPQLISLADTNKQLSSLAVNVFRRKYSKKIIRIFNPFYPFTPINNTNVIVDQEFVKITHFGATLKVLRNFGHEITTLELCIYLSSTDVQISDALAKINTYIGMYCADTLIEFDVSSYEKSLFRKMFKPFKRVERVFINGRFDNFDSETLAFEDLFPAMQKLDLLNIETTDGSFIARKYPNLQDFTCAIRTDDAHIRQEHVQALLEKNRQIRRLRVSGYTRQFLKNVSKTVLRLECLEIEEYDADVDSADDKLPIVFENVRNLTIFSSQAKIMPKNIHFPNLVELNMDTYSKASTNYLDIIRSLHQNATGFKTLRIWNDHFAGIFVSNDQLEALSQEPLSRLQEAYLMLDDDVTDRAIINFLDINQAIRKLHLCRHYPQNSFESLAEIIQSKYSFKWRVMLSKYEILLELEH